jgi:predicted RNA methylase
MGTEKKYRIIREAQRNGHPITFDVLYYAKSKKNRDIVNEIGEKEGEFIRKYRPILNTQIPKEEDWHKWDINVVDAKTVLNQILMSE